MKEHLRSYFPQRFEDSDTPESGPKAWKFLRNLQKDSEKTKCENIVVDVFEKSNELKLLAGAMKRFGCNFNLLRHVACESCFGCHGGFDPDSNQIVVCSNLDVSANRVMATMMHEMIHMFDYCRANFDFTNLEHVACSEIRAANLTYCSITDKINVGGISSLMQLGKSHQFCVKDVAYRSVKAYSPGTEDSKVWDIVDKVFPWCYNDLEPFGRRPMNGGRDFKQSYRERYYYGYIY